MATTPNQFKELMEHLDAALASIPHHTEMAVLEEMRIRFDIMKIQSRVLRISKKQAKGKKKKK
jgi:hypothetical protein